MMESLEKSNRDKSRDYRRQQLIDATIRTISMYGLSKTTVAKVTAEANLSAGTIGFYFNSKEQLLIGTLRYLTEELNYQVKLAFEFSQDPMETLELVIDTYLSEEVCDIDKIAVWYAFASENSARKEYMEISGEYDHWFHQALLDQVKRLCTSKNSRSLSSAQAISRGLEGLIDGFWQDLLYQPDAFDREDARKTCYEYLEVVFPDVNKNEAVESRFNNSYQQDTQPEAADLSDCLPVWSYYDDEFLELEKNSLFRKNWLLVGHVNDMPDPGDYLTMDVIGERAMVVRGNDGEIRAFHNVCRHRGAKIFEDKTGKCSHAMTCPFHGWTYQLDGKLIGVPAENSFDNLHKDKHGLINLDLELWMGFVFIRIESGGASLQEQMKPIENYFKPYKMEDMFPIENSRGETLLPYNWKVVHDIDNEGYHVPIGHPSLQQLYGKNYKDTTVAGIPVSFAKLNDKPASLWSVRNYQNLLPKYDHLPEENQRLWLYGTIFPSMVIGLYPDSIEYYMTIPVATDKTLLRFGSYALPDASREAKAAQYLNRRINRITTDEDETYVRTLQEGMRSSVFPKPNLSSLESGVREFHHKIQEKLPVARLAEHPGEGKVGQVNDQMNFQ